MAPLARVKVAAAAVRAKEFTSVLRVTGSLVACAALFSACASTPPPDSVAPAEPAPGPSAQLVNALVLANGCQSLGKQAAAQAESAMNGLVEGCASVPGGSMQFHATLQPGGRIEISAAPGQSEVVPICILKHPLVHHVPLTRPCPLDVKIEQTSVQLPPAPSRPATGTPAPTDGGAG